mmetsp:Transcript_81766/g.227658  ORF Transcript_81766/g.227658 Transcript_81766/m.227658 type:complete len:218 (+) Transcript_81766:107-760(+)
MSVQLSTTLAGVSGSGAVAILAAAAGAAALVVAGTLAAPLWVLEISLASAAAAEGSAAGVTSFLAGVSSNAVANRGFSSEGMPISTISTGSVCTPWSLKRGSWCDGPGVARHFAHGAGGGGLMRCIDCTVRHVGHGELRSSSPATTCPNVPRACSTLRKAATFAAVNFAMAQSSSHKFTLATLFFPSLSLKRCMIASNNFPSSSFLPSNPCAPPSNT